MSILAMAIGDVGVTDDEEKEDRELSQTSMDGSFRFTTLRQTQYVTKCVYQALERLACDVSFNKAIWSIISAPAPPEIPKPRSTQSHKIQPEVPQNPSTTMDKKPPVNIRTALSLATFPPYPASTSPPSKRTNAGNQCRGPSYWAAINGMLEDHVQNTIYKIKVAMLQQGQKERIAGWMCCSLEGDPEAYATHNFAYMEWTTAAAFVLDSFEDWQTQMLGRKEGAEPCKRRRELFNQISRESGNVQRTAMEKLGNSKYLVIKTIVTDPAFQGQGAGSELLRRATELADKEQISIWAHVPKAASVLFASAGFAEVEGSPFIVDIVDPNKFLFARIPEGYDIMFMVREARFNSEERSAIYFQRLCATIMS